MNAPSKRRYPKVLADELIAAFRAVDELDQETCFDLLERFRRNRASIISTFGIDVAVGIEEKLKAPYEAIPYEWHDRICQLDRAFTKLHAYNAGGHVDYVAKDVYKFAQGLNGSRPKPRLKKIDIHNSKFKAKLTEYGFFKQPLHREDRGNVVRKLAAHYGVSISTINRHLKEFLDARIR